MAMRTSPLPWSRRPRRTSPTSPAAFAGGILNTYTEDGEWNRDDISQWLQAPGIVKENYANGLPDGELPENMPNLGLSERMISDLVAISRPSTRSRRRRSWRRRRWSEPLAIIEEPLASPVVSNAEQPLGVLTRPQANGSWKDWVSTVDHKKIGIMYGCLMFFFLLGGLEALLIRTQLAFPSGFLSAMSTTRSSRCTASR